MSRQYEPLVSSDDEQTDEAGSGRRQRRLVTVAFVSSALAGVLLISVILIDGKYSASKRKVTELERLCATTPSANGSASTERPEREVCTTSDCVISASRLLRYMDPAADPCQDFYRYACGRWPEANPRPAAVAAWTEFGRAQRLLRTELRTALTADEPEDRQGAAGAAGAVYRRCVNMTARDLAGVAPLVSALSDLGGWPALEADWSGSNYSWARTAVLAARYTGSTLMVSLSVSPDERNASRHLLHVDQPALGMERGLLAHPDRYLDVHAAYERLIADTLLLLRGRQQGSAASNASSDAAEIREFEVQLAQITVPDEYLRNISRIYNKMTLRQLQNLTDQVQSDTIGWSELVGLFLALDGGDESLAPDDMELVVLEPDVMRNLSRLLRETDNRTLANYLAWRVAQGSLDSLTAELAELRLRFERVRSGAQSAPPVERSCFDWLNEVMGPALSYMYVKRFFSEEKIGKVSEMVADLSAVFRQRLDGIRWMDDATREQAHVKVNHMISNVGYPDWMANDTALDDYFQAFVVQEEHFDNYARLNQLKLARNAGLLSKPVDRNEFRGLPTKVNAYYEPTVNSITIPAAILQPVFYGNGLELLNYARIGMVIGHEVTHGFDDLGRQFDALGSEELWWTPETLVEFERRASCVVRQYGNYSVPELSLLGADSHVNGQLTVGENIADGGGLGQAYQAYFERYLSRNGPEPSLPALEHLSPQQLFFVANAQLWCASETPEFLRSSLLSDPHSPRRFRVVGTVSNSEHFSSAFSCAPGTAMNPEHKCSVW